MQEKLILVNSDQDITTTFYAISHRKKLFDENWLQNLLIKNPSLLPVKEIDANLSNLIPLGREVSVTVGSIDNLYITQSGEICLVETKLWRNPEAHRTVVAQILDYAKDISKMTFDEFKECVEKSTLDNRKPDFWNRVSKNVKNLNQIEFQDSVQKCINQGKFLLLIVGDKIHPEVAMLLDTIQSAPNLDFRIGLIEIKMYKTEKEKIWPLLVIPKVVGKTKEVTRAVVKIIYEKKKPEIDVIAVGKGKTKTKLNLQMFEQAMPDEYAQIFIPVLEQWIKDCFTIKWGISGFGIYFSLKKRPRSILDIYPDTFCLLPEKIVKQKGIPLNIYHRYREAIAEISVVHRLLSQERRYLKYTRDIPLEEFRILVEATDKLVRDLNSNYETAI